MDWYVILTISFTLAMITFIFGFLLGCECVKSELKEILRAFDHRRDDERISVKVFRSVIRRVLE